MNNEMQRLRIAIRTNKHHKTLILISATSKPPLDTLLFAEPFVVIGVKVGEEPVPVLRQARRQAVKAIDHKARAGDQLPRPYGKHPRSLFPGRVMGWVFLVGVQGTVTVGKHGWLSEATPCPCKLHVRRHVSIASYLPRARGLAESRWRQGNIFADSLLGGTSLIGGTSAKKAKDAVAGFAELQATVWLSVFHVKKE